MWWFERGDGGVCQYEGVGLGCGRPGGIFARASIFFFDGLVENVSGCSASMRGYLGSEVG